MRFGKFLLGVAAAGVVAVAFRDFTNRRWLRPALPGAEDDAGDAELAEPILGYDGMDRDTLIDWLRDAQLDEETLLSIRAYEEATEGRMIVLETVDELLS